MSFWGCWLGPGGRVSTVAAQGGPLLCVLSLTLGGQECFLELDALQSPPLASRAHDAHLNRLLFT